MTMVDEVKSGNAQLLDVRTSPEWEEGHAEQALHIPLLELLRGKTDTLVPTKKIYIYCATGGRAYAAAEYLNGRGFQAEAIGGLADWLDASN